MFIRNFSSKENCLKFYNDNKNNFENKKHNKINFFIPESKRIENMLFNNINNFKKENIKFFRDLSNIKK